MDKINSDDLRVKILSFLPTKVAVTTSVLSKRWKFLWMWVPNLEYDDHSTKPSNRRSRRLRPFIKRKLPLHRAPVLESLRLKLSTLPFQPEDIKQWVEVAVSLCVQDLSIDYSTYRIRSMTTTLPICLYTSKSLVSLTLKLDFTITIDIDVPRFARLPSLKSLQLQGVRYLDESFRPLGVSHTVCFPSLKSLHLKEVVFLDKESLGFLLANCPDLEELVMEIHYDNFGFVSIVVPSLKSLSLYIDSECSSHGVEIVAPSLKYIKLEDYSDSHFLIENMPDLEEAEIHADI